MLYKDKFLVLLILSAIILRFVGLGYSHYYGDETKALYLDKTISAKDFLLDQRKGPAQFLVAWAVEKATGGYTESAMRFPFAAAGVLSVLVFYLLVKELFGTSSARVASMLFNVSGLNIAFSRIVQYQSFLILLGLIGVYCMVLYKSKKNKYLILGSSVSLGVAFLFHYDAIFFIIPALIVFLSSSKISLAKLALFFMPLFMLIGVFYIPYLASGNFSINTTGYLEKRVTGAEYSPNNSLYTLKVYNPFYVAFILLFFVFFAFSNDSKFNTFVILGWFLVPFIVFELLFSNPGTHINNYMLPLYVLSGVGAINFSGFLKSKVAIRSFNTSIGVVLGLAFLISLLVFVPAFKLGYPWNFGTVDKQYHLYLYGFPYYRGWDQIRDYLNGKQGVRNFYTNDNTVTSKYYLQKYDVSQPGTNFLPQYYIYIHNSQEFKNPDSLMIQNYALDKLIYDNNVVVAEIYKLKPQAVKASL